MLANHSADDPMDTGRSLTGLSRERRLLRSRLEACATRIVTGALLGLLVLGSASAAEPDSPSGAAARGRLATGFTAPDAPLEVRFARPPAAARLLKIIHGWPDEAAEQDRWRTQLLRQGFGGVVCNVSFREYLESEPRWEAFRRAVTEAKAAGMALWLYDERGYPSGNAGGLVLRDHPEWEAEGLLVADIECGPGPVSLEVPPGELLLAAAFPLHGGPTALPERSGDGASTAAPGGRLALPAPVDGRVSWEAPPGRWHLVVMTRAPLYAGTHAEGNLAEPMPYVNLLRPEPTQRFLEVTHGRYAARLGPDLGRWFEALFTDEPSLMSMFFRRMPYRPLPWAPDLPAEFRRRRGYDLLPTLPDLVRRDAGPAAAKHRHDFWRTVGELVSENFFGQIQTWGRQHGVPSGGHLLAEENIVNHVPLYGDFFQAVRRMDAPGIDCLTSVPEDVPWYVARLVASAAELEGRRLVMCETSDHAQVWRAAGDARPKRVVSEAEIRGTVNRLMVAGVNVLTSYYSFTGLNDEALRRLNEWVGRCATLLTGGHQVADIAVVYPVESLWTRFVPAAHGATASPEANRIGSLFRTVGDVLFEAQRDFTVVDSRALAEAQVEGDALVHGSLRWRVVVLPGVDTLPLAAWQNLDRFARNGGWVVGLGTRPRNSATDFPSDAVRELGGRWFGTDDEPGIWIVGEGRGVFLPAGTEVQLARVLEQAVAPALVGVPPGSALRVTHRRIEDREVYFLVNDSRAVWRGELGLPGAQGPGRWWDPATGTSREVSDPCRIPLELEPHGAGFLTFGKVQPAARKPVAPGRLPGMTSQPLRVRAPALSHGEFVRGELVEVEAAPGGDGQRWEAKATLTKSQVDTFLFVRLPLEGPASLAGAEWLEIESRVPEGQRTPAQLLVILHEEGGGDFLAETPRSLGVAGRERTFIPLNRFQLAGWSQDADGVLDPARVREVRVGWGGYYGSAGERVEFGLAVPRFGPSGP